MQRTRSDWDQPLSMYHTVPLSGPCYSLVLVSSIFSCFVNSNLQCLHILFWVILIINLRSSGWTLHPFVNEQKPGPAHRAQGKAQSLSNPWFAWASMVSNNSKVNLHSTVALSCYLRYIHQCKTEGKDSVASLPQWTRCCSPWMPPEQLHIYHPSGFIYAFSTGHSDSQWKCTEHSSGRLWGRNHGSSPQGWRWESPPEWWMLS